MDIRPSLSLRSPLARLNSNQQRMRDRDQDHISTLFSPGGGTTTRAASRKLRSLFDVDKDDKISSFASFATSSGGNSDIGSRSDAIENLTDIARKQPKNNEAGPKISAASKKIKSKSKSKLKKRTSIGRWETWERFEFLRGLRNHGRGHWKLIGQKISTRSTIQVKTHAQVMLRKQEQGINIFEELDEYEQKEKNQGRDANLHPSSFLLPRTIKDEKQTSNMCHPEEPRYFNKTRQRGAQSYNHRFRHSFPLANEAQKNLPPFQPVTTTTVTTTMVGNNNRHHPFHHQGHHHYGARHNLNYLHHPYRYTPSFDSAATAASVAAAAASSALFPTNHPLFQRQTSSFQAPIVPKSNHGSSLFQEFLMNEIPYNIATHNDVDNRKNNCNSKNADLLDDEVEAVEALLSIRTVSENTQSMNI